MINRRLLRIKVLHAFYAYEKRGSENLNIAEKELFHSIEKTMDLYYLLLLLMVEIVDYSESRIDLARDKRKPTDEDLNPNTKFAENWFVDELENNLTFRDVIEKRKLTWVNNREVVRKLHQVITSSEDYQDYMSKSTNSKEDKKFIITIFTDYIFTSEDLYQCLEEQSIYWNDDVEFTISRIIKTIKKSVPGSIPLPKMEEVFTNDDDRNFGKNLFRKAVMKHKNNKDLIGKFVENWDVDRIAMMDILIMELAITEMVEFSDIPVKVSLNEYIELAKIYSSRKSGIFINGILDKITENLKKEKVIVKKGKGLIGEL
ncbi:MAG: transcription antitermination factor NusB [Bacteroidales bacterium]|nr:transcription antitermination factor NusB [Bacteroidales bacterium]